MNTTEQLKEIRDFLEFPNCILSELAKQYFGELLTMIDERDNRIEELEGKLDNEIDFHWNVLEKRIEELEEQLEKVRKIAEDTADGDLIAILENES